MYHPTTRVLTVLELLQSHSELSGPELARRLEVSARSVRRYVAMLQDMGVPVEGGRGRHGAYRLRPGYRLPPLMFSEDEVLALVVGLRLARRMSVPVGSAGVEGALAKVERVMPERLRGRVRALQEALTLAVRTPYDPPAAEVLLALSEAVQRGRAVRLRHRAEEGAETERVLEPHGVVYYEGRWFVVGHCRLRGAARTFRIDRVAAAEVLDEPFERPADFDGVAAVERALATTPGAYRVVALLDADLDVVRCHFPPAMAELELRPDGVLVRCNVQRLPWLALRLASVGCRVTVCEPPELRDELRRLAEHVAAMAGE